VNYVAPFDAVRTLLTGTKSPHEDALTENVVAALRLLLVHINVDEGWYLARNPDISQAIAAGAFESAKQHFVEHGYFEGRLPFPVTVDEGWYLSQNPDVWENVRNGSVVSAQRHFETDGYREGRLPFALDGSGLGSDGDRPLRLVSYPETDPTRSKRRCLDTPEPSLVAPTPRTQPARVPATSPIHRQPAKRRA
jgi:hypothetical protein